MMSAITTNADIQATLTGMSANDGPAVVLLRLPWKFIDEEHAQREINVNNEEPATT